ncbi:hypothetical protein TAO_0429 [Candidatus Nitrosoglobus terrae]|uniref:Uncharacterized protein n=1 Tax=Candidatus Nitrosoglobus terrae TaxID=1630141 RepID=A0A1Q2SL08_9GAMM|nr:hypothetical protein [Candidatus Nitrosoglobus terrae]BAW79799.1 hypothetical protein TAO_0429 [Candidatus Nitrosoglobus terrae]
MTWKSETFNIERFNFAYGQGLDSLAGQWYIFVPTGPSLKIQTSSTLSLSRPLNGAINGTILDTGQAVIVIASDFTEGYNYVAIISPATVAAFNLTGQDTVQGIGGNITATSDPTNADALKKMIQDALRNHVDMTGLRVK